MKQILTILFLVTTLLTACEVPGVGGSPAPTAESTADFNATVSAISKTMLAGTLTAQPTGTFTPTAPPLTDTPAPSATPALSAIEGPTLTESPTPTGGAAGTMTATAVAFVGCFVPSGTTNLTAPFKLENFTKKTVSVSINGVTQEGDHTVNCSYDVAQGASVVFTIWWGKYTYWVEVPGKKMYQGSFWINDSDKATMQITDKGIKIGPFP